MWKVFLKCCLLYIYKYLAGRGQMGPLKIVGWNFKKDSIEEFQGVQVKKMVKTLYHECITYFIPLLYHN